MIGRGTLGLMAMFMAGGRQQPCSDDRPQAHSTAQRTDLAEADAIILAHEGKINGVSPSLTALEAFTMADLALIASELTAAKSSTCL